jgi:hypothetical protein
VSAYDLAGSPYDGSGQTVAVIDAYASRTIFSDVNQWSVNRGLRRSRPASHVRRSLPGRSTEQFSRRGANIVARLEQALQRAQRT